MLLASDAPRASLIMTPLGPFPAAGIAALRAFGAEADRLEFPFIDVGGFIVPGLGPAAHIQPGLEDYAHGESTGRARRARPAREEAGPPTGSWQGPASSQAPASGSPPHTFERELGRLNLDFRGLVEYHPHARVTASSAEAMLLDIPVGLFHALPGRARLTMEVSLAPRPRLTARALGDRGWQPTVPDVRAWARWEGGPLAGQPVRSHHAYPDDSICACMPHEWIRGVHPLRDYVAFTILWIGKSLHEILLQRYPGRQHYGAWDRVRRDRVDEYCGCGSAELYRECCRAADLGRTLFDRWLESEVSRRHYLSELASRRRLLASVTPPR